MTNIANRTIAENGTITVDYTFAKVVAKPFVNKYDETRYEFEVSIPEGNCKRAHTITLDNDYMSLQDEWNLLSGIEEAARDAIKHYRDHFKRKIEDLSLILAK